MQKQFVVIAGNIATGKTTLAKSLAFQMHCKCELESVDDNPYLTDFYRDMKGWALHLQFYFLSHRVHHHRLATNTDKSVILDRSIYEDANVFAAALHKIGNITDRDFATYLRTYEVVSFGLKPPTLLIYLTAPLPLLVSRIRARARPFEKDMSEGYLSLLNETYESWISTVDFCPILRISVTENDDFRDPILISKIVDQIENKIVQLAPIS